MVYKIRIDYMNQTASIASITGELNVVDLIVFVNYLLNRQKREIKGNVIITVIVTEVYCSKLFRSDSIPLTFIWSLLRKLRIKNKK